MADNVAITAGTGTDIATDQVTGTGEHVQIVKLAISTDGSRSLVPADGTNGLAVDVKNTVLSIGDGTNAVTIDVDPADAEPNSGNALHTESRTYIYNGTTWDRVRGDITNGMDVDVTRVGGQVQVGDGTNAVSIDTSPGDSEANTVNCLHVEGRNYLYNGSTWDRIRGDITNGLDVDVTRVGGTVTTQGDVAHDTADSGSPMKVGAKAIAHGANPTAVAASDRTDLYANRHGILFNIGGHPNIITRSVHITDAAGPQTDASMVGTIASGTKVVVTAISVTVDFAVTTADGVAVKIGFGATTIPADSTTGANGVLLDHPGIAAGSGIVLGNGGGILGIGGDGEELRLTCEDPVGGNLAVTFSYYTIES